LGYIGQTRTKSNISKLLSVRTSDTNHYVNQQMPACRPHFAATVGKT